MAYEYTPKEGYGSFISNSYKTNEKQPDFTGTIMLDGKIWKIGIWENKGTTNGREWRRLAARVDTKEASNERPTKKEVKGFDDIDSDVPF